MTTTNLITAAQTALDLLRAQHDTPPERNCPGPDKCPTSAAIRDLTNAIADIRYIGAKPNPEMTIQTFVIMGMAVEANCISADRAEKTINLLVAGGNVSQQKVDEARKIIADATTINEATYPPMNVRAPK